MAAAALAAHKRPAADEEACPADEAGKKRVRHESESIHDHEALEEIGEGTTSGGVVAEARDRRTGDTTAAVNRIHGSGGEGGGGGGGGTPCLPAAAAGCPAACREQPTVVQVKNAFTFQQPGKVPVLITELAFGPSLRSRLTRAFSEDETRGSMRQLLRAAEEMHAAGRVHGYIHPGSILVGPDDGNRGTVEIRGFGYPWSVRDTATRPEEEDPACALRCRSPEQLIRSGGCCSCCYGGCCSCCYGPEVDVWALGCVMAELLTGGEPLFTAATEEDVIAQALDLHDDLVTMGVEAFDGVVVELSVAGREVLAGLLAFHAEERLTAADALKHRWFAEEDAEAKPPAAAVEGELSGSVPSFSEA